MEFVVEVDEEHGDPFVAGATAGQLAVQSLEQHAAGRQSGQRVVRRRVDQAFGCVAPPPSRVDQANVPRVN